MNYKIIGSDQKEYGPISIEQLRQWLGEGRLNAQTRIQAEGSPEWKPLSEYPELASLMATLTAPPAPFGGAPTPEAAAANAQSMINGPAIGLLVTAGLGAATALLGLALNTLGLGMGAMNIGGANDPSQRAINMLFGGAGIVQAIIHLIAAGVILFGALKMRKLVNHRLAMASAIVALVPCVSPCCLLGMPFGIWALVVLVKPEVKAAFH